eukprot:Skav222044  [mRNA]  locus=scaffold1020:302466:303128:- [translate_table: standard]
MLQSERKDDWNSGTFQTDTKSGGAITCSEQQGDHRTSTHDNTLGFQVCEPSSVGVGCSFYPSNPPDAHISSMVPASYAITVGQPVPWDCFATGSSTFTFTAGRKGSSGARDAFMSGLKSDNIMVSDYDSSGEAPDELNFMLEGDISFTFECNHSYGPVLSARLRFGQGHYTGTNNWWVGGSDCQKYNEVLNCGPLTFMTSGSDKFWFEPSAGWDAYCKST